MTRSLDSLKNPFRHHLAAGIRLAIAIIGIFFATGRADAANNAIPFDCGEKGPYIRFDHADKHGTAHLLFEQPSSGVGMKVFFDQKACGPGIPDDAFEAGLVVMYSNGKALIGPAAKAAYDAFIANATYWKSVFQCFKDPKNANIVRKNLNRLKWIFDTFKPSPQTAGFLRKLGTFGTFLANNVAAIARPCVQCGVKGLSLTARIAARTAGLGFKIIGAIDAAIGTFGGALFHVLTNPTQLGNSDPPSKKCVDTVFPEQAARIMKYAKQIELCNGWRCQYRAMKDNPVREADARQALCKMRICDGGDLSSVEGCEDYFGSVIMQGKSWDKWDAKARSLPYLRDRLVSELRGKPFCVAEKCELAVAQYELMYTFLATSEGLDAPKCENGAVVHPAEACTSPDDSAKQFSSLTDIVPVDVEECRALSAGGLDCPAISKQIAGMYRKAGEARQLALDDPDQREKCLEAIGYGTVLTDIESLAQQMVVMCPNEALPGEKATIWPRPVSIWELFKISPVPTGVPRHRGFCGA